MNLMPSFKQPGISLFVAFSLGLFAVFITIVVMNSILRSSEQISTITKSNHAFFAIEAGIEAALYHQNARGQGVDFSAENFDSVDFPASQTITIGDTTTKWFIEGRTDSGTGILSGSLKLNQLIQIPLTWDQASDVSENADLNDFATEALGSMPDFRIEFDPDDAMIRDNYTASSFNFGSDDEEPLIQWSVSRINSGTGELETFIPRSDFPNEALCSATTSDFGPNTGYYCEHYFWNSADIDSRDPIIGQVLPARSDDTLDNFYDGTAGTNYRISFYALLPYNNTNSGGNVTEKISEIPFELDITSSEYPQHYYSVQVQTTSDDFESTASFRRNHKTTVTGLDSLILE